MRLLHALATLVIATTPCMAQAPAPVDFTRDVRPILSDRCFPCHGPDEGAREGGFRLDVREDALADLGGYAAIVPGDPGASELVYRIRETDFPMPPPDSNLALSAGEIRTLERWIEGGAPYAKHWAFEPPSRPERPVTELGDGWARDELDRFVAAALEREGLEPAPEADRATWLRRVTLNLTGLPPTHAEIDAFLADAAEGAHARVVDRLLASPRFGEHMAAGWLELARYADTYGYQSDVARRVWPWRDWVIDAINANLPYDEFATWQLAGDLLHDPTREQRIATTFNRLHRQTNEGGSVEEEFRIDYVADRVNTFGMAFLGLTLECARCHDHKFDPVSQREYYGLSAYFDDIDESGLYSHFTNGTPTPALLLTTVDQDAEIERLRGAIARVEAELAALPDDSPPLSGCVGAFRFEGDFEGGIVNGADAEKPGRKHDKPSPGEGARGQGLRLSGENNVHFPGVGEFRRWDPFSFSMWMREDERADRAVILHRSRAWTDAASCGYQLLLEDGRPSFSLIHFWPGDALRVRAVAPLELDRWSHVAVTYDGSSRADGIALYVDGAPIEVEVIRDDLTKDIVSGGDLKLTIGQRFRDKGFKGGGFDELTVFDRELRAGEIAALFAGEDPVGAEARDTESAHARKVEELRALRQTLGELVDDIPEIMTMEATPVPRTAHLLLRGAYDQRGEAVEAHVPAALRVEGSDGGDDRLTLARWMTARDNPLFARVAVNRLWQHTFGVGLVGTPEDFGSQGAPPTHPELLDELALDFAEGGYDVKALVRRLVLSATYRQSSRPSAVARERDPENRLLSRSPSPRLTAEELRDLVLATSGLLVEEIGGPSVKPYQPDGLWREKSGSTYQADKGAGLWRRSLYTFWKRTSPPPSMMIFDAGKREVCSARRGATNTPLQALVLWNDPQRVEAARVLAERAWRAGADDAARLAWLFRALAGRPPHAEERDVLLSLLADERDAFGADPDSALALLSVGEAPRDEALDPSDIAALTVVATTLFSYDAVVTRR